MLILLLSLVLAQVSAQSSARGVRPRTPAGTAILRGVVVDEPTGAPVAGARVTIRDHVFDGRVVGVTAETTADHDGRFEFTGLPAGRFIVYANAGQFRATHLYTTLGHEGGDPLIAAPSLELTAGEVRTDVRIALKRSLAFEGRVVNEFGEPMANVEVSASDDEGRRLAATVGTDDRGHFRIFGLREGQYTPCASAASDWDRRGSSGEGLRTRYDRTCAAPIVLAPSGAMPFVEIHLQRIGAFVMTGSVVSSTGRSVNNLRVQVIPRRRDGSATNIPTEVKGDRFVARGLVPGDYTVVASISEGIGPREAERVRVPIRIEGADVNGLVLTTTLPGAVIGRVVLSRGAPPLAGSEITVRFVPPLSDRGDLADLGDTVSADGTFSVSGIHGPKIVIATGFASGWFVESVFHGEENITDLPREFRPGDTRELVIVLSNRSATLRVRPVDADGKPRADAFITLIPADASRWQAPPFMPFPPARDEEGFLELAGRRPGEYFVTAVPTRQMHRSPWSGEPLDAFARIGRRITLVEGETLTLDLPVTPLEMKR